MFVFVFDCSLFTVDSYITKQKASYILEYKRSEKYKKCLFYAVICININNSNSNKNSNNKNNNNSNSNNSNNRNNNSNNNNNSN